MKGKIWEMRRWGGEIIRGGSKGGNKKEGRTENRKRQSQRQEGKPEEKERDEERHWKMEAETRGGEGEKDMKAE